MHSAGLDCSVILGPSACAHIPQSPSAARGSARPFLVRHGACRPTEVMCARSQLTGNTILTANGKFVTGLVRWPLNHVSMAARSYVWPSEHTTGSSIISLLMGQMYSFGTSSSPSCDTLSSQNLRMADSAARPACQSQPSSQGAPLLTDPPCPSVQPRPQESSPQARRPQRRPRGPRGFAPPTRRRCGPH